MYRNKNFFQENSKIQNTESNKFKKGKLLDLKQNLILPTSQSTQSQNIIQNNDSDIPYQYNYINSNYSDNGINSMNEIKKENQNRKNGKTKKFDDIFKKTYINNFKPRNKKFHIIRNGTENDIAKYFSKNHNNKSKQSIDNILDDFDINDSNKNNVFYLVNDKNNNKKKFNIKNIYTSNNNNRNQCYGKKISKVSLPFCVYSNYNKYITKPYPCDFENCPGCVYCHAKRKFPNDQDNNINILNFGDNDNDDKSVNDLYRNKNLFEDNKFNNSFDTTPNLFEKNDSDQNFFKRNIIPEDDDDDDEYGTENIENENDIGNELDRRNNISIHCFKKIISLPHDNKNNNRLYLRKMANKNGNNPKLNLSANYYKKKNKNNNEMFSKDNGDSRKNVKSVPNNYKRGYGLKKDKKIELLRE